jgi:chromosome segregation ATPase
MGRAASAWLLRWFLIGVVFVILNLILYGAQDLLHMGDKRAFRQLDAKMRAQLASITTIDSQIARLGQEIDAKKGQVESMRQRKGDIEQKYARRGAPPGVYAEYTSMLEGGNELIGEVRQMVREYNRLVDSRKALVGDYNRSVPRINKLADTLSSHWYIIPIPMPKMAGREPVRAQPPAGAH